MSEIEEHIKEWIDKISEFRPELNNFAICPFSSTATYKIIQAPIDDIMPLTGCDVVIFAVEDYLDVNAIQMWCEIYNTIRWIRVQANSIFIQLINTCRNQQTSSIVL